MTLPPNTLLRRIEDCLSSSLDGEVVLMSPSNGSYITLNETGGAIWTLLAKQHTVQTLLDALCNRFEARPETIREEVLGFLNRAQEEGFIAIGAQASAP
ncbi:MAG: PqqD family protein [Rhodospirillaceae bacterium]